MGYAIAAMVLDDPNSIDTLGFAQAAGFNTNVENNNVLNPGWYNEGSVQAVIYDLYDDNSDGADNLALGFGPIFLTMRDDLESAVPFNTIHAFIDALKQRPGINAAAVDQITQNQSIFTLNSDAYGTGETNNRRQQ